MSKPNLPLFSVCKSFGLPEEGADTQPSLMSGCLLVLSVSVDASGTGCFLLFSATALTQF